MIPAMISAVGCAIWMQVSPNSGVPNSRIGMVMAPLRIMERKEEMRGSWILWYSIFTGTDRGMNIIPTALNRIAVDPIRITSGWDWNSLIMKSEKMMLIRDIPPMNTMPKPMVKSIPFLTRLYFLA